MVHMYNSRLVLLASFGSPVVLFIMLHVHDGFNFLCVIESVHIQMKGFNLSALKEPLNEIPKCVHCNERHCAVLSCGAVYYAAQNIDSVDKILKCNHSKKATEQYFLVVLFVMLFKVVLAFECVGKILEEIVFSK